MHLSMTLKRMHTCFVGNLWTMYRHTGMKHAHKGRTKMIVSRVILHNTCHFILESLLLESTNWPLET